jgi:hypothetical protein
VSFEPDESKEAPEDREPQDEGQGASGDDAGEQAGTPGEDGQDEDGQASGNPKNAG